MRNRIHNILLKSSIEEFDNKVSLQELFDKTLKPYRYWIVERDRKNAVWQFKTDSGLLYEFQVYDSGTIFDDVDFSYVMLTSEFYVIYEDNNDSEYYSFDLTNRGEMFRVMRTIIEIVNKRISVIDEIAYWAYVRGCEGDMTEDECRVSPYVLYMEPKQEEEKEKSNQRFGIYMKYIEKFSSRLFHLVETDNYSIYLKRNDRTNSATERIRK